MLQLRLQHVRCKLTGLRRLSTITTKPPSPDHSIYISKSTNPYFNLSFEDWLFRHKDHKYPLLLLYRDDPCVVIGRNQNPWKEVNMPASQRTGIPFIRRRSGGGTVYHDLGNTNFSIHLPRHAFDRHATAQVVLRAVRSLGVDANVNERNDICVGKDKIRSAYKIVNNRAYHHGTMLISTRLDTLGNLLRSNKDTMETRGVASVRSPVRNLQQFNAEVTHERFVDAVITAFKEEYEIHEQAYEVDDGEDSTGIEHIRRGMKELPSWDWAYGQTPEFTYTLTRTFEWGTVNARIHSKHGIILGCDCSLAQSGSPVVLDAIRDLCDQLNGQRYGFVDESALQIGKDDSAARDVWHWLKAEMSS